MAKRFLLRKFSKYFLVFCSGVAIASILPVVASPIKETAQTAQTSAEVLLAQSNSEASLNILAGCLDRSGYRYVGLNPPPVGGDSRPVPGAVDGRIANANNFCANLRVEEQIQQQIRCLDNGEVVQVQLNNGKPIVRQWNDGESTKNFIFVIAYKDGSKGWVWDEAVAYNLPPRQ